MSRKRSETKARARKGDRVKEETGKKLHKRDKDKTQNNDVIARHTHSARLGSAQCTVSFGMCRQFRVG